MINNTYDCSGYTVIEMSGALDVKSVEQNRHEFQRISEQAERGVVIDMNRVNFIDSSGVGALVFMYKRLVAEQRLLHLVGLNNQPQRLIKLLRINQTISTHTSIQDFTALPQIVMP